MSWREKARRRGDVVEHVMQAVIRRGAHQNAQLRFLGRDVFETRQAGLGPHGKHEGVPGRNDGDGADRHRLFEDALPAQRDRQHGGGIDHRKIDFARRHRENAFGRAHAGKRHGLAAARMLQHHLGQNIVRHRVGGGATRHFRGDFQNQTRARDVGIGDGRGCGRHRSVDSRYGSTGTNCVVNSTSSAGLSCNVPMSMKDCFSAATACASKRPSSMNMPASKS